MFNNIQPFISDLTDVLGSAQVVGFVSSLRTLFILIGVVFLFFIFYYLIKAGYFSDKMRGYKWRLEKEEDELAAADGDGDLPAPASAGRQAGEQETSFNEAIEEQAEPASTDASQDGPSREDIERMERMQ